MPAPSLPLASLLPDLTPVLPGLIFYGLAGLSILAAVRAARPRPVPPAVRAGLRLPARGARGRGVPRATEARRRMSGFLEHITLMHFLTVGAVLFCAGITTVLARRNAVGILIGLELILN